MFAEQKLHRIGANYMPHNARSGRLLAGLGFRIEGYARDYLYIDGAWRDHVLTSLVNDAFRPEWLRGAP
jgi:ribosomal-protein-alanine N-acetyltransferase